MRHVSALQTHTKQAGDKQDDKDAMKELGYTSNLVFAFNSIASTVPSSTFNKDIEDCKESSY